MVESVIILMVLGTAPVLQNGRGLDVNEVRKVQLSPDLSFNWASSRENMSFRVSDKAGFKLVSSATETS